MVRSEGGGSIAADRGAGGLGPARPGDAGTIRFINIDRLRVAALIEIVVFHVHHGTHVLGGFGLPTFLLFTSALNARRASPEPFLPFLARKASLFIPPWVAWCVAYAALQAVSSVRHGEPPFGWFEPWMLVRGTWDHLWYLPFALLIACVSNLLHHATARVRPIWVVSAGVLTGLPILAASHWRHSALADVWGIWGMALPAVPFGVALGRCLAIPDFGRRARHLLVLGAVGFAGCLGVTVLWPETAALRYAAALAMATGAAVWPGHDDLVTRALTHLRFGMYLVHPLFIREYYALTGVEHGRWVETVAVLIASAVFVAILRLTPLRPIVSLGRDRA